MTDALDDLLFNINELRMAAIRLPISPFQLKGLADTMETLVERARDELENLQDDLDNARSDIDDLEGRDD